MYKNNKTKRFIIVSLIIFVLWVFAQAVGWFYGGKELAKMVSGSFGALGVTVLAAEWVINE